VDDVACPAERYCDPVDARCALGCRLGERAACPGDQSCSAETRVCGFQACAVDADCPDAAQYCDRLGANATRTCRVGCRDDASCGAGGRCAPDRTCVYLCESDADCPGDRFCDTAVGRCVPLCRSNDDCGLDEVCDPFVLRCVRGCREDAFEPDDTPDVARPVELGAPDADGLQRGALEGQLCGFNPDGVTIRLEPAGRLFARVDFDPTAGLNVRRIDPTAPAAQREVVLSFDRSPAVLTWPPLGTVAVGGDVYLGLELTGIDGSPWRVDVATAVGERACFDDEREGPDDAPNGASRLARDDERLRGSLCAGDADWFVVRLQPDDGLALSATALDAAVDVRVEGWRGSRVAGALPEPDFVTGPGQDTAAGRTSGFEAPAESGAFTAEDWYLRVRPAQAGAQIEYALDVTRTPAAGACLDDAGTEPNNAPGVAVDLDARPALAGGGRLRPDEWHAVDVQPSLCARDVDVFCLLTDVDDRIEARVGAERDKRVRWIDNFGDPLTDALLSAPLVTAAPVARIGRAAAGRFCALVSGDSGPYVLQVRRSPAPVFECAADSIETDPDMGRRNDAQVSATPLPLPGGDPRHIVVDAGYLCDVGGADDVDWYRFAAPLVPTRMCLSLTQFENSGGDVDVALYATPSPVDPEADPNAPFCETTADCVGDDAVCLGGLCTTPTLVAESRRPFEALERLRSEPISGTGERWLRVRRGQPPGNGVPYRLEVSLTPDADGCDPDYQERDGAGNNTADSATPLGQSETLVCDAWICRDEWVDGDHYRVTVPAGEDRTVFLRYDGANEGRLWVYAQGPLLDPADPFSGLVRSDLPGGDTQCLNLRGGAVDTDVDVNVFADRIVGSRVDYTLEVVPTDLVADPTGACVTLGSGALDACPPRAAWPEFAGFGRIQPPGCVATYETP